MKWKILESSGQRTDGFQPQESGDRGQETERRSASSGFRSQGSGIGSVSGGFAAGEISLKHQPVFIRSLKPVPGISLVGAEGFVALLTRGGMVMLVGRLGKPCRLLIGHGAPCPYALGPSDTGLLCPYQLPLMLV
jgi:hypothetical protein